MTGAPAPEHLAHLPRVSGLTLHAFPNATLTLEDGSTYEITGDTDAALGKPTPQTDGCHMLFLDWRAAGGDVFLVPPAVLPEFARMFSVQGTACHLEATPAALLVNTTAGDLYQFTAPLNFTVTRRLDPQRPDRLTLTDGAGWPVGIFDLPAGTPGASIFQREEGQP